MTKTYDLPEYHVLLVGHNTSDEPILDLGTYGPFESVEEAQEYARAFREHHGIPGHASAVPTPEENEAWSEWGYTFAIKQLTTDEEVQG